MKERPILMATENVKAILDGSKIQTRRVIKPQPELDAGGYYWNFYTKDGGRIRATLDVTNTTDMIRYCPYGQVGDRLWVRETWAIANPPVGQEAGDIITTSLRGLDLEYLMLCERLYKADGTDNETGWRPSIFMPRWASRIPLEITGIRAERLQGITWKDIEAEGVVIKHKHAIDYDSGMCMPEQNYHQWLRVGFMELWDSLNPKYKWETNPWVWVIEYKRVQEMPSG